MEMNCSYKKNCYTLWDKCCHRKNMKTLSLKDIRKTLYQCRNFEINHLWQRSLFLVSFIVLCFTGYGYLFGKIFTLPDDMNIIASAMYSHQYSATSAFLNFAASFTAFAGIVLSLIYICMAKGSKAWYEVYEHSITHIESKYINMPKKFIMGNLYTDIAKPYANGNFKIDNNIFSTSAGGYSVSKLNIMLGQVSLLIWILIFLFHVVSIFLPDFSQIIIANHPLFFILVVATMAIAFTANIVKNNAKSSQFD